MDDRVKVCPTCGREFEEEEWFWQECNTCHWSADDDDEWPPPSTLGTDRFELEE